MEPNEKHVVPQIGQESQTVIVIFDHPYGAKREAGFPPNMAGITTNDCDIPSSI